MKRTILILTTLIALISCTPEDKTKVELENKLGELSLKVGASSVAIDYEIVSYSADSITSRTRNQWDVDSKKRWIKNYKDKIDREVIEIEKTRDSTYSLISFYREAFDRYTQELKDLEATLTDEVIAIEYTVVIAYYNPILKVDVTQKKLVTLTDLNKLK